MADFLSRLALARISAGFIVLAGLLGSARAAWFPVPATHVDELFLVSGLAILAGALAAIVPWNRLHPWALIVLPLLSLVLIGANGTLSGEDERINAIYYVTVFMWVGMALPRGATLVLSVPMAVSFAVPLVLLDRTPELAALSVLLPACVFVGEIARWLTVQLTRAEQESKGRAAKMASLVEATLDLATCDDPDTLAKRVARGAAALYEGVGALVLLRNGAQLQLAARADWPGQVPDVGIDPDVARMAALALEPCSLPFEPDRLLSLSTALGVESLEILPIQGSGEPLGLAIVCFARDAPDRDDFTRYVCRTLATQAGLGFERLRTNDMLRHESLSDPLTQIGNRRGAWAALDLLKPGDAVAILDLDHFKKVNDSFGHAAGDRVLRTLAGFLQASVRSPDAVFRYGGEEFLLILSGAEIAALPVLERIHSNWRSQKRATSFSAGIAVHRDGESPEDTLERADAALYDAKRRGRDRVVSAEGEAP